MLKTTMSGDTKKPKSSIASSPIRQHVITHLWAYLQVIKAKCELIVHKRTEQFKKGLSTSQ